MKARLTFIFLTASCLATAQTKEEYSYLIFKKKEEFKQEHSTGLLLSKNCFKKSPPNCEAIQNAKSLKDKGGPAIVPKSKRGALPGIYLCLEILKAEVILGYSEKNPKGFQSFCSFKDKSRVSISSLSNYLLRPIKKAKHKKPHPK